MKYYKYLYLSEGLERKKEKIIARLEQNKLQPGTHLLVLPGNKRNHLELLNAMLLMQPSYPKEELFVVGIAKSYEDGLELVEKIAREVYDITNGADIRNYILLKEQDD